MMVFISSKRDFRQKTLGCSACLSLIGRGRRRSIRPGIIYLVNGETDTIGHFGRRVERGSDLSFDRRQCQLPFKTHPLLKKTHKRKIWDKSIQFAPLLNDKGAKETIGSHVVQSLQLNLTNEGQSNPFKRCSSYQNFCCFYESKHRGSDGPAPLDYGSDLGDLDGLKINRDGFLLLMSG
jgi:hypothetical protein